MQSQSDIFKGVKNKKDLERASEEKYQKNIEKIGEKLRKRRISLKREIKDVASALHITPARLERIEAGNDSNLWVGLFYSLCNELELDPHKVIVWKV